MPVFYIIQKQKQKKFLALINVIESDVNIDVGVDIKVYVNNVDIPGCQH